MEQAVAERPLSQEQQLSQLQMLHNGTVDTSAAHLPLDPPLRQYPRRRTGWGRTKLPSSSEKIEEDKGRSPIGRNNIRGKCTRGSSCKFRHDGRVSFEEASFSRNERQYLETAAEVYSEIKDFDLQKRCLVTEDRSRRPCRNFQRGSCYRGSSCNYLHSGCTNYERPTYLYANDHRGVGAASRNPGSHQGTLDENVESWQGHDVGNKGVKISSREQSKTNRRYNLRPRSFPGESRKGFLCQNFLRVSCNQGRSCVNLHPITVYERASYDLDVGHHQGLVASSKYHRSDGRNTAGEVKSHEGEMLGGTLSVSHEGEDSARSIQALKAYSRKRKRKRKPSSSKCCLEKRNTAGEVKSHEGEMLGGTFSVSHEGGDSVRNIQGLKAYSRKRKRKRKPSSSKCRLEKRNTAGEVKGHEGEMLGGTFSVSHEGEDSLRNIQALKAYSRKRKRKRQPSSSKCCLEPLIDQVTDSSPQHLPIKLSVEGTSLDHRGVVSVSGVTDDLNTSAAKRNTPEMVLVNEHPTKQKRDQVTIIKFQDVVVESSAATSISRRKLLVLDLNGLLADIVGDFPDRYKPDTKVSTKGVFKRPFCDEFLQFCFERFDVGVWSSRTKKNVSSVVNFLLKKNQKKKLLFCWNQSHCTRTGYKTLENQKKPLVLKELKKLWENGNNLPWKKGYYNETNTVLLDDSPYKALRNPPYSAVFPFPYSYADETDNSLGPDGDLRLYLERLAKAENTQKFIQENPFGQRPITKENPSWAFYSKIVKRTQANNKKMAAGLIPHSTTL